MNKIVLTAILNGVLALSACGKSADEIELEREKIALQREMLKQQKHSAHKSETKEAPQLPAAPQTPPQAVATAAAPSVAEAAPKQEAPRRVSKGVLTSNAKQYAGGTLLRSLQEYYRDNESILCGEYMVGDQFYRFVFVQTYNEQQGTWVKSFLPDRNYSHEYTQNIWREYCR